MSTLQVVKAVAKEYPGLLEEGKGLTIYNITGALETLYVQSNETSVLQSPALMGVSGLENDWRSVMVTSGGLGELIVGEKTILSTVNSLGLKSAELQSAAWIQSGVLDQSVARLGVAISSSTGQIVRRNIVLDPALVKAVPYAADVKDVYDQHCDIMVNHIKERLRKDPELIISYGYRHLTNSGFVQKSYTTDDAQLLFKRIDPNSFFNLPTVPGYSRVMYISDPYDVNNSAACQVSTYVKGDSRYDHIIFSGYMGTNGTYGYRSAYIYTGSPIGAVASGTKLNSTAFSDEYFYISAADLKKNSLLNPKALQATTAGGVLLFGPPKARLRVIGETTSNSEDVVIDGIENPISVTVKDVIAEEFLWQVDKTWYNEYMDTGFYIFNPRASNIRENVRKEWDALEYDNIAIRGLSEPLTYGYTVLSLPEAVTYAKGRAKACKDNDWLKQVASTSLGLTWGQVQTKEVAARGRTVFMSPDYYVPSGKIAGQNSTPLKFSTNGVNLRDENGKVYDRTVEDDLAVVVYHSYFVPGSTFPSGFNVSEFAALTADELSQINSKVDYLIMSDVDFSDTTSKMNSFGNWIDPSKSCDVANLTPEQQYRIHIENSIAYDRMSSPLFKVLTSFGALTLIARASKK